MKVIRYVDIVLSGVGDKIKQILSDPPCKCCIVLQMELEDEKMERKYLQDLIFRNTGLIKDEISITSTTEVINDQMEYVNVQRGRSVSSIRKQAEQMIHERAKSVNAVPATISELTEAERLFTDSLKENRN